MIIFVSLIVFRRSVPTHLKRNTTTIKKKTTKKPSQTKPKQNSIKPKKPNNQIISLTTVAIVFFLFHKFLSQEKKVYLINRSILPVMSCYGHECMTHICKIKKPITKNMQTKSTCNSFYFLILKVLNYKLNREQNVTLHFNLTRFLQHS